MKGIKVAILTMAMCGFCVAQTETKDKKPAEKSAMAHDHDKAPAAGMEMPKPPVEIQKMNQMLGTWSATIKTEPGPWSPKGGTDKGSMVVKKGPGGFSIVQDFKSNGAMGPFVGHGNVWWDKDANHYQNLWCDSMAGCTLASSKMESDKKWTMDMPGEFQGKKVKTTINGSMSDDGNSMHEEFMDTTNGSPGTKTMTIDYKRVGKAMAAKPAAAKE